jgi:hypothetical protein
MKLLTLLFLFSIAFLAASLPVDNKEPAVSADAFVDSVGVNVHLHFGDTPYGDFASVENSLKSLGVRHIRDGLIDTTWAPYYQRLNTLGRLGIKSTLITSPKQSDAILAGYPRRVPQSFEAYEAPNEYDQSHDPDWAATLNAFVARLYKVAKSDPATSKLPIVGPSLTRPESFSKVAVSSPFFDFANMHNYLGGRNPGTSGWGNNGYGSIDWNLNLTKRTWTAKPVITTENGYLTDVSKESGIPEDVAGKYVPRLFLEQWMHGIRRTYLYELVDIGNRSPEGSFGLLHSDFSPKPSYRAVQSLLRLLVDPGPTFPASGLDFELSGNLANVHHLLLEKRNGIFYLVIWIEKPSYDVDAKKELAVPEQRILVQTKPPARIKVYHLDENGTMQSAPLGLTQTVDVDDRITLLQISPQGLK